MTKDIKSGPKIVIKRRNKTEMETCGGVGWCLVGVVLCPPTNKRFQTSLITVTIIFYLWSLFIVYVQLHMHVICGRDQKQRNCVALGSIFWYENWNKQGHTHTLSLFTSKLKQNSMVWYSLHQKWSLLWSFTFTVRRAVIYVCVLDG